MGWCLLSSTQSRFACTQHLSRSTLSSVYPQLLLTLRPDREPVGGRDVCPPLQYWYLACIGMGSPQNTLANILLTQLLGHLMDRQHSRMLTSLGRLDFSQPASKSPVWSAQNVLCRPSLSHAYKHFFPGPLSYYYTQPGASPTLYKTWCFPPGDSVAFLDMGYFNFLGNYVCVLVCVCVTHDQNTKWLSQTQMGRGWY